MQRYRRRELDVFLTREDSAAFEQGMLAAFPRLACYRETRSFRRPVEFRPSLAACPNDDYFVAEPDADWEPLLKPVAYESHPKVVNPPPLCFFLRLNHQPYTHERKDSPGSFTEDLHVSKVVVLVARGDEQQAKFANRLMKILRDISTPRLAHWDYERGEYVEPARPVTYRRAGHHAVRWYANGRCHRFEGLFGDFRPVP